jgi:hypothetical protein
MPQLSSIPQILTDTASATVIQLSNHAIKVPITIDDAARDAGATPTTTLRKGLALGEITASGKYAEYHNAHGDGTQTMTGILDDEVRVIDLEGNAVDALAVMIIHGYLDESECIGVDAAGKVDVGAAILWG